MRGFNGSIVARGPPQGGCAFRNSDIFIRDSAFGNLGYPYLDFRIVQSRIPVSGFQDCAISDTRIWISAYAIADTLVWDSVSLWRRGYFGGGFGVFVETIASGFDSQYPFVIDHCP